MVTFSPGQRFGRLEVVRHAGRIKKDQTWLCRCDCGLETQVSTHNLTSGRTKSCGCWKKERRNRLTHGMSNSPTWKVWVKMRERCLDSRCAEFPHYGGRGILVCERWVKFENFLADMGEKPEGLSIDRIQNNGNYEPGNCQWATDLDQMRNTRRNKFFTYNGQTKCMSAWEEELHFPRALLWARIQKLGWSIEKALSTPARQCQRRNDLGR